MSLPKPEHLRRRTSEIRTLLKDIEDSYRVGHDLAYPTLRGSGEAKVVSGRSDPTGDTATNVNQARRRLGRAWRLLGKALEHVRDADAEARAVFQRKDDFTRGMGKDPGVILSPGELAELEAARRRRAQRGEGLG